jgi:hypothetical protein
LLGVSVELLGVSVESPWVSEEPLWVSAGTLGAGVLAVAVELSEGEDFSISGPLLGASVLWVPAGMPERVVISVRAGFFSPW